MKTKITDISKTKKEIEVEIDSKEMEEFVEKAVQELASEMTIKGFRPGKAPREVVENSVGKDKVWAQAAQKAIEETYPKIIREKELFTLSQPEVQITKTAPGNPLHYKATVYTMPEIDLPDYKDISEKVLKKEGMEVKVEKKEIEETLERIRESRAEKEEVKRGAKENDEVTLSFTGKMEGKDAMKEENLTFTIGDGQFDILKGFEDEIKGMKEGEEKSFEIETPKESPNKELAGKKIDFQVKMEKVKERKLPQLDDQFAKSLHQNISSLKELKEKIEEGIASEKKNSQEEKVKTEILKEIMEKTSFEVPQILIEKELDNMIEHLKNQLSQSGVSYDKYLEQIKKSEEELRKEWEKSAKENVATALILYKISEEENIEVEDQEIENEMDKHFKMTGRKKEEENEENLNRLKAYIYDVLKNQKVFNLLLKK